VRRAATVLILFFVCLWALGGSGQALAHGDLGNLEWQPRAGAVLPLAASLTDAHGRTVPLGRYFVGKPVILLLEYLHCKSLCGVTLRNIVAALGALPLDPGRDFQLVALSIDPRDKPADAAAAKKRYLASYHRPGIDAGVHFLTGPAAAVHAVAQAIGFPYRYDADEYVHPAGFVIVGPNGRISRYFLGVGVRPAELRAGLADATQDEAIGPLTRILLLCHIEGTPIGRFDVPVLAAFTVANLGAIATLIVVFAAILRRRRG
jgi:protein SCO1/2